MISSAIMKKVNQLLENKEKFERFQQDTIVTHGLTIYKLIKSSKEIDYAYLHSKYSTLSYDEVIGLFSDYSLIPVQLQTLLQKYFSIPNRKVENLNTINGEINAVINGYKERPTTINISHLYNSYLKNATEFSEEERLYLECYVFNKRDKAEFNEKYGPYKKSKAHRKKYKLITRLEKMHYKIDKLSEGILTKSVYHEMMKENSSDIPPEIKELLDQYFGYKTAQKTSAELAEIYGISKEKMRNMLVEAKDKLLVIKTNRSQSIKVSKNIYYKYIDDRRYEFPENTRTALHMFVIDGKDHKTIAEYLQVTSKEVAVMLSKGIQKIDFYRFGILEPIKVEIKKLNEYIGEKFKELTIDQKRVAVLKYREYKENKEIADITGKKLSEINRMVSDLNSDFLKWLCKDINITTVDVEKELLSHPIESILSEEEKQIISLYAGVPYKDNNSLESHSPAQICTLLNLTGDLSTKIKSILAKLKAKKIGYTKPDLLYGLSRAEVIELLADPHLPIAESDKELIIKIMGIGYESPMTFKQIASHSGENEKTLRRRYQMAMVNMNKYIRKEISGIINYELDVIPNLKYFCKTDRILLEEFYKNGLTVEAISKKYKMSKEVAKNAIAKVINYLYLLQNFKSTTRIDFDYIEKVSSEDDLPFNGNGQQLYQAFSLSYGNESFSTPTLSEVSNIMGLKVKDETLKAMIDNFILACLKHKDNIRRGKTFSYEDISAYYKSHEDNLSEREVTAFQNYMQRYDETGIIGQSVGTIVRNLMLENSCPNSFNVSTATREDVIKILKNNFYSINRRIRDTLMARFNISGREFMSGKEKNQLYRQLEENLGLELETGNNARTRRKGNYI